MARSKEEIVCYDAGTTVKSTTQFCSVCGSRKVIEYKDVPELKAVIIECCGPNKYDKFRKHVEKQIRRE